MAVKPMPFATRAELVRTYDPFHHGSERAAFAALRKVGVVSAGVAYKPRSGSGRVLGTVHLYCGLNRDAVRLYRRGEVVQAGEMARAAGEVERRADFQELIARIAEYATPASLMRWADVQALLMDAAIASLMQSTASIVLTARQDHDQLLTGVERILGMVVSVELALAVVLTMRGRYTIPVAQLAGLGLDQPGAAVELAWEFVDPADSVVTAAPAIPDDAADVWRSPFSDGAVVLRSRNAEQYLRSTADRPAAPPPLPIPLPTR